MEDEENNGGMGGAHHEESRVHHSPGCRDDLPSTSVKGLLSDDCIQDFKLDISDSWGQQKHWVMVAPRRKNTMHNADDGGWWSISSSSGTQNNIPTNLTLQSLSGYSSIWKEEMNLRSSQRGPSLVPHWKPWTMLSLTEPSSALSTYRRIKRREGLTITRITVHLSAASVSQLKNKRKGCVAEHKSYIFNVINPPNCIQLNICV